MVFATWPTATSKSLAQSSCAADAHGHRHCIAGETANTDRLGVQRDLDGLPVRMRCIFSDIAIFPSHELAAGLDDRYAAAEPAKSLCHLDTDIAASRRSGAMAGVEPSA